MALVMPDPATWVRSLVAQAITHPLVYPFITLAFALPFSPLLVKAALDRVRGRKLLPPIPPTEEVAAALVDKRYGSHGECEANGIKFHYVETGVAFKGRGPALLFLHGFPEFWYSWRNQLEALGAAHHCIAVDLRGYGWSDKPPAVSDYVIEKLVGDVKGLVHALGYGEQGVVLVGHDWGGNIAWYAAHMLGPALIKRLVVCNCPHPLAFLENGTFKQLMRSWYFYVWQCPWIPELMMAAHDWYAIGASFRGNRMGVRRPDATMTPLDVAVMKHAFSQPGVATGGINFYRANFFRPTPPAVRDALRTRLRMPVLVIWGEGDEAMGVELLEGIRERYADDLRLELLPGTSHWVQVDNPREVSRLIGEFARAGGDGGGGGGGGGSGATRVTAESRL